MLYDQRDRHISRRELGAHPSCVPGNLRLFFGGSGGLTAVRTMLETAATAQQTGVDIVVGLVNSCGCSAIDRLLSGFEQLPALNGASRVRHATRIDIDAAKKRAPAILLVDTRTPSFDISWGSNSALDDERWADLDYLVTSGMNVWAGLDATGFSSWASVGPGVPSRLDGMLLL